MRFFCQLLFCSNKGGQAKFIDMWRCWTPNQLPLLTGNLSKVLFLSAPSTGKTALMEAKAFQCMQMGMNVLFLLPFAYGINKTKTLLTLKMQQQWKNLKEKHQWQNDFDVVIADRSPRHSISYLTALNLFQHLKITLMW